MINDLRRAFREAVANFRHELHRDEVPREADALLERMRARARQRHAENARLRQEVRRTLEEAQREEEDLATCRRRERLAREVNDEETARVAADFAERHRERRDVLYRKALALRDELGVREREAQEMDARLAEARKRRDALESRASRTAARETLQEADSLFQDLDRLAHRVTEMETRAAAAEELTALSDEMDGGPEAGDGPGTGSEQASTGDLDERLDDLKRRMTGR